MRDELTRRGFLATSTGAALSMLPGMAMARDQKESEFLLLGDLHLDRLEHHDMEWVLRERPEHIVREIENYSRLTREYAPQLFDTLRAQVKSNPRIGMVAQLGDFVEGMAGTPELAQKHCGDAVRFVKGHRLGVPFLTVKGNHDIMGPGGPEAYNDVMVPYIAEELQRLNGGSRVLAKPSGANASYAHRYGNALLVYFDSFGTDALEWLEETLSKRTEKHAIVMLHRNVVPFGARPSWHVYMNPNEQDKRTRLLNLLGKHQAIVLSAHIHEYGLAVRETESGSFLDVSLGSVITRLPEVRSKMVSGVENYTPDLVLLDSRYDEKIGAIRRGQLAAEQPHIRFFESGHANGYAIISVREDGVHAKFFSGIEQTPWRVVNLTELLEKNAVPA